MLTLGIETSSACGSVAVVKDGKTLAKKVFTRTLGHSDRLIPACDAVLRKANVKLADLDGVAVGTGPGSYTGLRVGIAAAKGLALLSGIPVVGVPSFDALVAAHQAKIKSPLFFAVSDAKRGEYYLGAYEKGKQGHIRRKNIELIPVDELKPKIKKGVTVGGPDWNKMFPTADAVAALGAEMIRTKKKIADPEPIYIRPFIAKKSEEQKWTPFAAAGRK